MKTITGVLEYFVEFLQSCECEEGLNIERWVSQPLNSTKADETEIIMTEQKLGCSLPIELKDYYLNEANGSEVNQQEYAILEERLDIFSHQRIVGIVDYFSLYWGQSITESPFEYDTCIFIPLSESEKDFINKKNKEYFVCIAVWSDNFIETFVFDKNHNFYRFYFDQDVTVSEYINEMINGSNSMKKDKSLFKLLNEYLEETKESIVN